MGVIRDVFRGKVRFILGLFGIVIYSSSINLLTPVLATISAAFPDAGMTTVQMLVTIPSLLAIPIELLSGFIVAYIHKKRLVQFSLIMVTLGGILPLVVHNSIGVLIAASALIGLGGFNLTLSSALVAENFDGPARGTMFGLNGAVQSIAMSILVLAAGYLGTIHFWDAYWVFVPAVIALVIVSVFFPLGEKEQKIVGKGVGLKGIKDILTPGFIFLCIVMIFAAIAQFAFLNNSSYLIADKGLGDAALAGTTTSLITIARIAIGLGFGFLLKGLKKFTLPFGFLLATCAFLVMIFATQVWMLYVANAIFGLAFGIQVYGGMEYVADTVGKKSVTMAMALFMCCTSIGVSLSPIFINTLAGGMDIALSNFTVAMVVYAVVTVVTLLREIFFHKDSKIGIYE